MDVTLTVILLIPVLVGIFLILRSHDASRWRALWQSLGALLLAIPCAGLAYFFTGIAIARARNEGHFFSFPFGGYAVHDSAILESLASWVVAFFCLIQLFLRALASRLKHRSAEKADSR